ncbi:hypothetical protein LJR016_000553 [Devosia sp. LjRoot16]|uniref:hypothetical protein n=1 Tax=Devosia sp. LjRoot16 TaxID=3342271 RepID=UPI003ECDDED1
MAARFAGSLHRANEPGFLYNCGNVLGFVAGLIAAVWLHDAQVGGDTFDKVIRHLAGSQAALALSLATMISFWGGIVYSRAWARGAPPNAALNRQGDLWSTAGAICLAFGLFVLGNPLLALSAGVLHAMGKLGSAWGGNVRLNFAGWSPSVGDLAKDLVLVSRVPAILSAAVGFAGDWLSASVIVCCLVWARPDWLLLSPDGAIRRSWQALRDSLRPKQRGRPSHLGDP